MTPSRSDTLARAAILRARFETAVAVPVEPPILQPAETLLDLYGEDIRGRAYVTQDAVHGEQMLRPDFTVPVVQMHMRAGAEPARYTYAGEVFRRQEQDPDRENEYVQVGYEVFDRNAPAASEAEVFALFSDILSPYDLRPSTGDIGVLKAAVLGLNTTDDRKAALMRHIWRPRRFRGLLDRFSGRVPALASRASLLASDDPFAGAGVHLGKRSRDEIEIRLAALRRDATAPALDQGALEALETLMAVRETAPNALQHMFDIAVDLPSIQPALERIEQRMEALTARGIDVDTLEFEASFGRTSMEYYDGFVFGFHAAHRPDLPPVATGGRYDALTRALARAEGHPDIPAVGGVLRPGLLLLLEGSQA